MKVRGLIERREHPTAHCIDLRAIWTNYIRMGGGDSFLTVAFHPHNEGTVTAQTRHFIYLKCILNFVSM